MKRRRSKIPTKLIHDIEQKSVPTFTVNPRKSRSTVADTFRKVIRITHISTTLSFVFTGVFSTGISENTCYVIKAELGSLDPRINSNERMKA